MYKEKLKMVKDVEKQLKLTESYIKEIDKIHNTYELYARLKENYRDTKDALKIMNSYIENLSNNFEEEKFNKITIRCIKEESLSTLIGSYTNYLLCNKILNEGDN